MRVTGMIAVLALAPAAGAALAEGAVCEHPAKLENRYDPAAPRCFVIVSADKDVKAVAARVGEKFHLQPALLTLVHGFVLSGVTEDLVAQLRCEPDVEVVGYDAITHR
jgi:hypothetical protein